MTELMRNFAMLLLLSCAANNEVQAAEAPAIQEENSSSPTVVIAKSTKPDGTREEVILVQPNNNENPLGDPLPNLQQPQPPAVDNDVIKIPPKPQMNNPQPSPEQPSNLGKQFQNTLMESNGMVYDVQAYPDADIKAIGNPSKPETIYSPNVNP